MLSVVVWQHIILFGSVGARGAFRVCVFLLVLWTVVHMCCVHVHIISDNVSLHLDSTRVLHLADKYNG